MHSRTNYAIVGNARMAYQAVGSAPVDLVVSAGGFNHGEVQWEDPGIALFLRRLAGFTRLIRFDMIGMGGSDRWFNTEPLPSFANQLESVLDASGSDVVALCGLLDGGVGAIEYAVDHPERVSHLILYNTTPCYRRGEGYEIGLDEGAITRMVSLIREGWGEDALTVVSVPSKSEDQAFKLWYEKYLRSIGTPTDVERRLTAVIELDVRDRLAELAVPTLILQRRDYSLVPRAHAQYLADHIAGAQYVELEGADGPMYWEGADEILRHVERFLRGADPAPRGTRSVLSLLFTDIVRSTERLEQMGDRDWEAVLALHNEICARRTAQYGGSVVKTTGDGMLAAFASPSDAIRAGVSIRDELARMDIGIRAGIHTGEVTRSEDDVHGLATHIASRVMGQAGSGELLVSRTVRDLVAGSAIQMKDRGVHDLKGVTEAWSLFSVEGADTEVSG